MLFILENFKVVINVLKILNIQYIAIKTNAAKVLFELKVFTKSLLKTKDVLPL